MWHREETLNSLLGWFGLWTEKKKHHARRVKVRADLEHSGEVFSARIKGHTLNQVGHHRWRPGKAPLLEKRHKKTRLMFVKTSTENLQSSWDNVLWTDETRVELFGNAAHQLVYGRWNEAHKEKRSLPTVKYGGASFMLWGYFAASGTGFIEYIEEIMKVEEHQGR